MSSPTPPANRLVKLGRETSQRRKPAGGPAQLTARHRLLITYMIDGCQHRDLLARIKRPTAVLDERGEPVIREVSPKPGEPLDLIEAADLLRIRRRNARELFGLPLFQKTLAEEMRRYRDGEKIASLRTVVAMRDDPGDGKAADRKVRLEASKALLGEDFNAGTTVKVGVQLNQHVTAGVVIRLPQGAPRTTLEPAGPAIEHEPAEGDKQG